MIVADVYAAGETPIEGVDKEYLVERMRRFGHRRVVPLETVAALPRIVAEEAQAGDLVVCLGAGDITAWGLRFAGAVGGVGVSSSDGSSPIAGVSAALRKAISGLPFPQDEAGYALHAYDLVFPELTQYRGGVFRIERFDAANVDTWFGEMNGDVQSVEAMVNHHDIFEDYPKRNGIYEVAEANALAEVLTFAWSLWARQMYGIEVECRTYFEDMDDGDGPEAVTVTFWSKR